MSYWGNYGLTVLANIDDPNWRSTLQIHPGTGGGGDGWWEMDIHSFGGDDRRTIQIIMGSTDGGSNYAFSFNYSVQLSDEARRAWQLRVWTALRDVFKAKHDESVARAQAECDALWQQLMGKDTLTLRRLEREELIRQTLLWIIGAEFDPAPDDVAAVINKIAALEASKIPFTQPVPSEPARHLTTTDWGLAAGFGHFVKFVHQAIEWESILYFLYPAFWGSEDLARRKLLFEHVDPNHRGFLRAGYARIVIPVRSGFEHDFTEMLDQGSFSGVQTSPYLPIADEIAAFARTSYTGIPRQIPKSTRDHCYIRNNVRLGIRCRPLSRLSTNIEIRMVLTPMICRSLQEHRSKTHGEQDFVYKMPGSGNDYDLISLGADDAPGGEDENADISAGAGASLIATWFDYTPTSGIDIEIVAKAKIS